jgi:hypothetical protein
MRFAITFAATSLMIGATSAKADVLYDAFREACTTSQSGVSGVIAATSGNGWVPSDPTVYAKAHFMTISPAAIGRTKVTTDGTITLVADDTPVPFPVEFSMIHLQICKVSIPRVDAEVLSKIKDWLGPQVSARSSTSGPLTTFNMIRDHDAFQPEPNHAPDGKPVTKEFMFTTAMVVVRTGDDRHPETSILYAVPAP